MKTRSLTHIEHTYVNVYVKSTHHWKTIFIQTLGMYVNIRLSLFGAKHV